jgi:hypothetical protein
MFLLGFRLYKKNLSRNNDRIERRDKMSKITYTNKVALNVNSSIPEINKVTADNMNEIKTAVNDNDSRLISGWNIETASYASNTTITVPSGALLRHYKGDKIKLIQNSITKYFYVIKIKDTLLTITGGSDYTLTSDTITEFYYSHLETPCGFPGWFAYTPTYLGFSTPPNITMRFKLSGTTCFLKGYSNDAGTANSNLFEISLPIKATAVNPIRTYALCYANDDGETTQAVATIIGASTQDYLVLCKGISEIDTSWTATGTKYCNPPFMAYEIE